MDLNDFHRPKLGIKIDKLSKGDWSLGLFLNHRLWEHWHNADIIGVSHEVYLYICFFKWNISIGYIEK